MSEQPERNLGMDLVRVTEAAAMAAARWMGRGQKEAGDQAAVDAMRLMLSTIDMNGVIVIGEGEKDEAPMLYNGEHGCAHVFDGHSRPIWHDPLYPGDSSLGKTDEDQRNRLPTDDHVAVILI